MGASCVCEDSQANLANGASTNPDGKLVANMGQSSHSSSSHGLKSQLTYNSKKAFKTIENLSDHYKVDKVLGTGSFGSVKLGSNKQSGMPCAIKIITKQSLDEKKVYRELNKNELKVLEETIHPHITRVFELMEDSRNFYIVMELITGGDLFDVIKAQQKFGEKQAASIIH